jgi:glucose-1-phosphate adenylyltransferase
MEATAFGVMAVDDTDRITSFLEKPADPPGTPADPTSRWRRWASTSSNGVPARAAAGTRRTRIPATISASDLIPDIVKNGKAMAHRFTDSCVRTADAPAYWRDVGTVDAFWKANLDLTDSRPSSICGTRLADLDLFGKRAAGEVHP